MSLSSYNYFWNKEPRTTIGRVIFLTVTVLVMNKTLGHPNTGKIRVKGKKKNGRQKYANKSHHNLAFDVHVEKKETILLNRNKRWSRSVTRDATNTLHALLNIKTLGYEYLALGPRMKNKRWV